jgi:hypothetical protein
MAQLSSLLDTGDKVASIVGAAATLAALWLALRGSARRRRNRPDPCLRALLIAQRTDAVRHRYRFFGEHVPALSDLYVRPRARTDGPGERDKSRTVPATQILHAHRHAVLLGDAGAGKSTFLASVAGDMARRALARRGGEVAVIVHASYLLGRRPADAFARAVQHDLGVDLPAEVFDRPRWAWQPPIRRPAGASSRRSPRPGPRRACVCEQPRSPSGSMTRWSRSRGSPSTRSRR